jgi:hypothetical protein
VEEYGGAPEDVCGLLRAIFPVIEILSERSTERTASQGTQYEMTVVTPATDDGLPGLLLATGVPAALGYAGMGMIKILDTPGLFDALGISAEVQQRGDRWLVCMDGHEVELSEGELVKLVFGPERRPDIGTGVFPVEFYQWPMDRQ